jgi:hemoglobin-like flavoprotein
MMSPSQSPPSTAPGSTSAPTDRALIEESLALAGERCADPAPRVYARLFARQPEMETLFWRDRTGAIKGEMLAKVFEAILDFVGERKYAAQLIQCEVVTHEQYDVPPAVFRTFFGVMAETLREILGPDWTDKTDAAWQRLLADLDYYVTHPDQTETAR